MSDTGSESWRKNATCGACSWFITDYGSAPTFYGHCKMYLRNGQRTSNDSTCHEFKPLPGFEEKVVLNVRTHVPDSRRAERRPIDVEVGSVVRRGGDDISPSPIVKRRRDGDEVEVVPEATRQFFSPPVSEGRSEARTESRREDPADDDRPEPKGEAPSAASTTAIAGALTDPGGGVDPLQMEDAMLDVIEAFGVISDVTIADQAGGLMILRPGDPELKAHEIETEALFHKFVMVRDRVRVMEQKINAHDTLGDLEKCELHVPITRMYGALTAFNSIFRPSAKQWRQRRPTRRPLEELLRRHSPRESIEIGQKWVGGVCRIKPTEASGEEAYDVSVDLVFDRVCRLKKRMRELDRAIKSHPKLSVADKDALVDYLSKCYGSLTTFNVLFRHREDWFSSK